MSVSLRCYSTSLGCPKNRVDTERLLGSLGVALVPVESPDEAELVFINTCAFIQPATEESVRTIAQAIADIEELPKRPLLAVAGCLVGRYHAEDLAPELPEVDLWLDNSDLEAWPAMLARKLGLPEPTVPGRILSTGPSYAWLKISDGCRHACSFCAIPNIRGGHRSHCKDMIVREARALLDQGVKELNLVAQDLTEWGCDLNGKQDLRTLLDGLLPLQGFERLRLMYIYPSICARRASRSYRTLTFLCNIPIRTSCPAWAAPLRATPARPLTASVTYSLKPPCARASWSGSPVKRRSILNICASSSKRCVSSISGCSPIAPKKGRPPPPCPIRSKTA